ncbi:MAG: molybdate ABC transporter permease subunit [Gammaproteobacteria bacterium]|nr:molybdate ABC transporter permease subunit [Gammaproteobacteria bacterium]
MINEDLLALAVTVKLAALSTLLLLLVGIPLAWWLVRTASRWRGVVHLLVALPLVLPPTVLGFYLLILLAPTGAIGGLWQLLGGGSLAFSFSGLLLGAMLYSLPFVVHPLVGTFRSLPRETLEVAATLGATPLSLMVTVVLPLARHGIMVALLFGFAHTLGEFGVVLMVGGNIPGETRLLSMALYEHVAVMESGRAHLLALGLLFSSVLLLVPLYALSPEKSGVAWLQR